ncbi:Mov34/MPN/PAD-1 family protein [Candidatus Pacearchaeota archaeon]|nr:Mov34/MPN/PAD-1 family protein [Candidatus Pacearchaeota archaeon]
MKIPREILYRCYAHCIELYPEEACGFISGPIEVKDALTSVHRMTNVMDEYHAQEPETYPRTNLNGFMIDFKRQKSLEEGLLEHWHKIKIIYHSHSDGKAHFSKEDRLMAFHDGEPAYRGVSYLVIAIKNKKLNGAVLANFNLDKKDFEVLKVD